MYVKDRDLYTPLHAAAASGNVECVRILINAGADIEAKNVYGNTPLHIACLNGCPLVIKALMANHVNLGESSKSDFFRISNHPDMINILLINILLIFAEAVNYRGQTAMHIAATSVHGVQCFKMLICEGLKVNVQSEDGRTPLHMTAIHGRFTRSKMLLDAGAFPDARDKNGNTALHIAAW